MEKEQEKKEQEKKQQNDKFFLFQLFNKQKEKKKKIDYDSIEEKINDYDKKGNQSSEKKQDKDKSKNITELAFIGALIKSCRTKSKEKPEIEKDFSEEIKQKKQVDLEIDEEQESNMLNKLKTVFLGDNISEDANKEFEYKSFLSLDELENELELIHNQDIEIGDDIFEEKEDDMEIGDDIFKNKNQDLDIEIGDDIFKKEEQEIEEGQEIDQEQEIDNKRSLNR